MSTTVIRHKICTGTRSCISIVVTSTDMGFTARYQRYYVNENGTTVLDHSEAFSDEARPIALWEQD